MFPVFLKYHLFIYHAEYPLRHVFDIVDGRTGRSEQPDLDVKSLKPAFETGAGGLTVFHVFHLKEDAFDLVAAGGDVNRFV